MTNTNPTTKPRVSDLIYEEVHGTPSIVHKATQAAQVQWSRIEEARNIFIHAPTRMEGIHIICEINGYYKKDGTTIEPGPAYRLLRRYIQEVKYQQQREDQ